MYWLDAAKQLPEGLLETIDDGAYNPGFTCIDSQQLGRCLNGSPRGHLRQR